MSRPWGRGGGSSLCHQLRGHEVFGKFSPEASVPPPPGGNPPLVPAASFPLGLGLRGERRVWLCPPRRKINLFPV